MKRDRLTCFIILIHPGSNIPSGGVDFFEIKKTASELWYY